MKVTDETVPEEDLEEAEDAAVVEKRPRRKLFYIGSWKTGNAGKNHDRQHSGFSVVFFGHQ